MAQGTGMTESYLYFNFPIEIYQASFPIVRVAYLKNATKLALQKNISLLLCFGYLPPFWQFVFVASNLITIQMGQPTLGYQLWFASLSGPRDKPTSHAGLGDLRRELGTEVFNGVWGGNDNRLPKEWRISKSQKGGGNFLSSALVTFF